MPTFYYLVPDQSHCRLDGESYFQYFKRRIIRGKRQLPIGGAKIIYTHCDMLNRNGMKAVPVHLGDFIIDWFPHKTQSITDQEAKKIMTEDDILICPEVIPAIAEEYPCKTRIAFIQNWALTKIGTGPDKRYEDFGYSSLLSCSNYLKDYMTNESSLPCHVVVNGIDLNVFYPPEKEPQPMQVLMLNRRNIADAREAIDRLDVSVRENAECVVLENQYSQAEIAEFFRKADIFLAIGYPEGFSLPPLEAMACGCAVIGFTGGGGLEHMIDNETALVAPDGDIQALSDCLHKVLTDPELKETLRKNGMEKAKEFSLAHMEEQLIAFGRHYS